MLVSSIGPVETCWLVENGVVSVRMRAPLELSREIDSKKMQSAVLRRVEVYRAIWVAL